jgi:hypothetical protein
MRGEWGSKKDSGWREGETGEFSVDMVEKEREKGKGGSGDREGEKERRGKGDICSGKEERGKGEMENG